MLSGNRGILCELCSVGIEGSVLCMLIQFLSNRSQHVIVDSSTITCSRRKLVNVVPGVFLSNRSHNFYQFSEKCFCSNVSKS